MIIWSRLLSLAILQLVRPISFSVMSINNIRWHISQPLVSILKSKLWVLEEPNSKCKYGIQLASNVLKLLPKPTIRGQLGLYWYTQLLIEKLFIVSKTGSNKLMIHSLKILLKLLWETSVTVRNQIVKSRSKRVRH